MTFLRTKLHKYTQNIRNINYFKLWEYVSESSLNIVNFAFSSRNVYFFLESHTHLIFSEANNLNI